MKPKLKIVEQAPVDISALIREDITKRDWSKVHCQGDKSRPVDLPITRKWKWF